MAKLCHTLTQAWNIDRLEDTMCAYGGPCLEGLPAFIFGYVMMMCFAGFFIYYDRSPNDRPGWVGVLGVIFWPLLVLGMFVVVILDMFKVNVDGDETAGPDLILEGTGSDKWPAAQESLERYFEWRDELKKSE